MFIVSTPGIYFKQLCIQNYVYLGLEVGTKFLCLLNICIVLFKTFWNFINGATRVILSLELECAFPCKFLGILKK